LTNRGTTVINEITLEFFFAIFIKSHWTGLVHHYWRLSLHHPIKKKESVQFVYTGVMIVGGDATKGTPTTLTRLMIWLTS
jgi:hypothetical protein